MNEQSVSELKDSLKKKDKIIASLSKYIEKLTNQKASFLSDIQTNFELEHQLKYQHSKLTGAQQLASKYEKNLRAQQELMQATMNSLNEGVLITDLNGVITYCNPAACRTLKFNTTACPGTHINKLLMLKTDESLPIDALSTHKSSTNKNTHIGFREDKNGIQTAIDWSSAMITDKQKQSQGIVFTISDITDAYNLENQLKHQATHDNLTNLINRNEFDTRLNNCLSSTNNPAARHSLLYIDLDQFKVVNDTCGHQAGDQLLRQLATFLTPKVRSRDTLARLGGDEFGVLLESCPSNIARKVANNILHTIQDFRFIWEDKTFNIGASIGIAHFHSGNQIENNPLSIADMACYKAKEEGRNRIIEEEIGTPVHLTNPHQQMQWVSKINLALEENKFVLFQQKIARIKPSINKQLHYEILIRLQGENELISPGAFLPPAERYSLIHRIDHWVIKNTFAWLAEHPRVLEQTGQCSINLSGLSLSDKNLSIIVKQQLTEYGIDCKKICFEITESSAIQNLGLAISFMTNMKKLGCTFSLDDFGTGMSSFSYLKQLPVDHLKIDGHFIKDIHTDPIDLAMTRSINEIAHVMGMTTIAEFVENEDILQILKHLDVDYAQGYHIAKPAPLDELLNEIN